MTIKEIKEYADMAETYQYSGVLNWGEVPFKALSAWVSLFPFNGVPTEDFDVSSVHGMFERWWKEESQHTKKGAGHDHRN